MDTSSKSYQIFCDKNDGFSNYKINRSEKSIEKLFDSQSVVYLTPDSDQILEEILKSKIYIIGGLVDDSVKKHSSLSFAKTHNIQTAKLPIDKYCQKADQGSFKQILTINQVFEILLSKFNGNSWTESFTKSLPQKIGFVPKL